MSDWELATDQYGKFNGTKTSEIYSVWVNIFDRCYNSNCHSFKDYGARGIKVAEIFKDFLVFSKHMGPRPKGMSINRINNDGNYEPGNVEWQTRSGQNRNKRKQTGTNSPFIGVTTRKRYRVNVKGKDGKTIHGGDFDCEIEAAKRADELRIKYFGTNITLNFPPHGEDEK